MKAEGEGAPPRRRLSAVAWVSLQFVIIAAAAWIVIQVLVQVAAVVIPLAVALLLAALFAPAVNKLVGWRVPRPLAATVVLVVGVAAAGGLLVVVVDAIVSGMPDLQAKLGESYAQVRQWLGSLGVSGQQLDAVAAQAQDWLSRNRQQLVSGAWGVLSTAGAILAGAALALFALIFLVYDGHRIWPRLVGLLPGKTRSAVADAGRAAFHDLSGYVRAIIAVAAIDAVGIGIGLWITGVPLVLPLAALVFLGAFVPLIGAFVSGMLAVLVALVAQGPLIALIVALIVIGVQQLEGNVFEPLIMGGTVKLHPLAVIVAVAVGVTLAGVIGALLAVPVLTTARAVLRSQAGPRESES